MDDLRYNPPKSAVADAADESVVPDATLKKIRHAWMACLVSAAMTLVFTLIGMASAGSAGPFGASQLIDVVFIVGMAFGIHRKSRTCAVLMFLYFAISKIWLIAVTGQVNGLFLGVVFLYYYAMGVAGTFEYHKLQRR